MCSSITIPLKQYADSIPTNSTRLVRYAYDNADAPRGSDGIALIFSQGNSREIYCFSAVNSNSILRLKKLSSTAWADEWTEFKSNNVFTGNNNPASNDANDFNTFGGYYISNSSLITNLPNGIATAGYMIVFGQYEGSDGRFAQVLFEGSHIWKREKAAQWGAWVMII